jgi:hypothetical protein
MVPNIHLILACHITGVYDVNRNTTLTDDSYELVQEWAESVAKANLKGIIFHNNFTEETCARFENEHISFKRVTYNPEFNPNVYRYFVYRDFLAQTPDPIQGVFVTDVSDVTLVKNPFNDSIFIDNPTTIFCGDEPKLLENDWMIAHAAHLRAQITDYRAYEDHFATETLLNCGIIGGAIPIFFDFLQQLCELHETYNRSNKTTYTGDMGAFNYLARTRFNENLRHGFPVNTVFKEYENDRIDCWFRHK